MYTLIPNPTYGKYYCHADGNYYNYSELPYYYDDWEYSKDTYPGNLSWQTASVSDDYAKVRWTTSNTGDYDSDTKDYEISFANDTIPYAFDIHKTGSKYYTDNHQSVSMSGSLESSFSINGSVYFGDGTTLSSLILELIGYGDYFSYEIDRLRDNPTSYMPYFTNIRFERY